VARHGATAILTLHRPAQRNALNDELRAALAGAISALQADAGVRSVVITGAGDHFCAGGDLKELQRLAPSEGGLGFHTRERLQALQRWLLDLVALEKPVIAAVGGAASGAGLSLALAADFIIAAPDARLCASFGRVALVPDAGAMYLLPRRVGLAQAKDMVFSGRTVQAEQALAMGLVQRVKADPLQAALAYAASFHGAAPQAIGLAKSIMNRTWESSLEQVLATEALAQAVCRQSPAHQDTLAAMKSGYAVTPGSFEDFADLIVPELQVRGR